MTERDKRISIIVGTVILAVLLLLFFKRGAGAGAAAGSDYTLPAVTGPNLGPVYSGGSRTIVIPGLNLGGPNLNMIGACCSDCMQSQPTFNNPTYAGPSMTINEGNSGPTVYNYSTGGAGGYSGFGGNIWDGTQWVRAS